MSATDNLGPHLLGRIAPEPDSRDWKLEHFLTAGNSLTASDDLDVVFAALLKSRAARATKDWAAVVMEHLRALEGVKPSPTPTPTPTPTPAGDHVWGDPNQLDQGQTGHCVGFGSAQFCNSDPINDHFADADGHKIYYECKVIDGEALAEDGSSVHSGAKALKNRGRIAAYAWASDDATLKTWVQTKGPIIIGADWYNDMFSPDASGLVHPTGGIAGGHCFLLAGWSHDDVLTFQNSWGSSFGLNGYFKMRATDFNTLLNAAGFEACAAVELPL